ncbi:uncharacterized protein LOC129598145 [Paramacrobiotus metropolitanus]|uniref:uncharacterized protein LOC129598145 n=1 Tax=Paramacrobiotus metropolitanus TaxID=2943436 RepID=UPI0024462722|nr:uncharacterized protein LOC129598145 [Paramacrobiotus metropolitanus]
MYREICCLLVAASCVLLVAADQPGDVNQQAKDRIQNTVSNINTALANAPPGSSVSVSSACTTVNGQQTCVDSKNTSSNGVVATSVVASGTGTGNDAAGTPAPAVVVAAGTPAPAAVVEVKTPAPTAAPSTAKVQIVAASTPSGSAPGLLASLGVTVLAALLARLA